jgi:hypothetical protein
MSAALLLFEANVMVTIKTLFFLLTPYFSPRRKNPHKNQQLPSLPITINFEGRFSGVMKYSCGPKSQKEEDYIVTTEITFPIMTKSFLPQLMVIYLTGCQLPEQAPHSVELSGRLGDVFPPLNLACCFPHWTTGV